MSESAPETSWDDNPPLLFKVATWLYPVLFTYIAGLFCSPLFYFANAVNLPIQGALVVAILLSFPASIVVLAFKSRWFLIRLLPMFFVWAFIYNPLTGLTQGSMSLAVSKAFDCDYKNIKGEKHGFP